MKKIELPIIDDSIISSLKCGDQISISGHIFCGRDAVLPKIIERLKDGDHKILSLLKGSLIFHTAVSVAGVGPTSSNKLEIETSIIPLSSYGVRIHLGKGKLGSNTISGLKKYKSIYCVIPPVTALLTDKIEEQELIAFPELGMEAFYRLKVNDYPAIVAVANGESIYDK